jgi:monoamine oxidase
MGLIERRTHLLAQINSFNDELTIEMLEQSLEFYANQHNKGITDGLNESQMNELTKLMNEPAGKETISEEEFSKLFSGWGTR